MTVTFGTETGIQRVIEINHSIDEKEKKGNVYLEYDVFT